MNMTLYEIEDGLAQLIAYRAERLADTNDPPKSDELAALDGEIDKYHFAEPVKVAGVAAMFRQWKMQRSNIKAEVQRLKSMDQLIEAMEERLKQRVQAALELLPEPAKGPRKLHGHEGSTLMLKTNGGKLPVLINSEAMIPEEFCQYEGRISGRAWEFLRRTLKQLTSDGGWMERQDVQMERKPMLSAIGATLEKGEPVAGASLGERGVHVEVR